MDVKLPDGRIVRNVPEGTTRAQLSARLAKASAGVDRTGAMGKADAAVRGFTDMASFGLADKAVAGLNAILPLDKATNPNIKSVWETGDLGGAFRNNLNQEERVAAYDEKNNGSYRAGGQIAGAVVGPVPGRGLIAAGTAKLANAGRVGARAAPIARIAAEGIAQSGAHGLGSGSSTSIRERAINARNEAVQGGAGALVGAGLVRGGARLISPVIDPAVAKLAKMGVVMTPGQRAGRGLKQWTENAAESVPALGVMIRGAKRRGIEQFNRGAINEALKPIGKVLPSKAQAGRTAIEAAQEIIGDNYDEALGKISAPADNIFSQSLAQTAQKAGKMPPQLASAFDYTLNQEILPLIGSKQAIDGATLQRVNRLLQKRIAGLNKSNDGISDILADNLDEVRGHFLDLAARHSPDGAQAFGRANDAYANMSRINDAASKAHGDGIFTPQQLSAATAKRGYGTTANNAATGSARMQDVADAGKSILPSTLPNSGTAERGALMAGGATLASGGAGAAFSPLLAVPALGAAPYTPGISDLLQKLALRGQGKKAKLLADEVRKRAYIGGILGAPVALQVGD